MHVFRLVLTYDLLEDRRIDDVICDLLLNRRTATWNLFAKYIYSFVQLLLFEALLINFIEKAHFM